MADHATVFDSAMQYCKPSCSRGWAYPVGRVAVKKILSANGAGRQISALVCLELGQAHAAVALHAMAGILAQSLPHTADVAEWAVIDLPTRLIVKQLTDVAKVLCHTGPAGMAVGCNATSTLLGTCAAISCTEVSIVHSHACGLQYKPRMHACPCTEDGLSQNPASRMGAMFASILVVM